MAAVKAALTLFLRHYVAALRHFTRLPIGPAGLEGPDGIPPAASAAHFPGVGLLAGMAACVVFALVSLGLPDVAASPLAAAVACTVATALLTGGRQEDRLAHAAEGLAAGRDPARVLAIMGEPHLGSHGALALLLVLAGKLALLAALADTSGAGVLTALLAGHVVSRFWPLLLAYVLPAMDEPGGADPLAPAPQPRGLQVAALWCVLPLLLMALADGIGFALVSLAFSALAWWGLRQWFARRLQGRSADCLGATQQVCEVAFYLGAAFSIGY